jgi:serine/threonine-protein kinase
MEYLEGEELRMLLKRDKVLPPERLLRIMAQVAIGLSAAHERKIIHRDLKPDNIFLCGTHDGDIVKILDFGSVRDNSANAKKLTALGTTIGSPFYMPPEQAQGLASLDHRADVWSLAAIAYECLTGTVPFVGSTGPAILLAILTKDAPPPSEVGAQHSVPKTVDDVMEEALAKNAEIRIPTIGALVDRLGHAYGLSGSHVDWARVSQQELGHQIRHALPHVLARYEQARAPDLGSMDAAFRANGGATPTMDDEDPLVMGVPKGPPKWLLAGAAVLLVVAASVAAFLFTK